MLEGGRCRFPLERIFLRPPFTEKKNSTDMNNSNISLFDKPKVDERRKSSGRYLQASSLRQHFVLRDLPGLMRW